MLAAGRPNYETVVHDADTQMGPDSQKIPSKRVEEKPDEPT